MPTRRIFFVDAKLGSICCQINIVCIKFTFVYQAGNGVLGFEEQGAAGCDVVLA